MKLAVRKLEIGNGNWQLENRCKRISNFDLRLRFSNFYIAIFQKTYEANPYILIITLNRNILVFCLAGAGFNAAVFCLNSGCRVFDHSQEIGKRFADIVRGIDNRLHGLSFLAGYRHYQALHQAWIVYDCDAGLVL